MWNVEQAEGGSPEPEARSIRQVHRSGRGPRAAAGHASHRSPGAAHDAVSAQDGFRIVAAGRREAALEAAGGECRRQRALVDVNRPNRNRRGPLTIRRARRVETDNRDEHGDEQDSETPSPREPDARINSCAGRLQHLAPST